MPGLVGVIDSSSEQDLDDLIQRMCQSIKHENWYLKHSYTGSSFAFGRVSLGFLNPQPQPIFNEDRSVCLVMHGEFFDSDKLKVKMANIGYNFESDNDAEFMLDLYEEYREDFVSRLNGSFTAAIWDNRERKLIIVNDRHGLRPLYYAYNGKFIFASEIKAILQDNSIAKKLNDEAAAEFLALEYSLGEKTLFDGISLLPPASILCFKDSKCSIRRYWDLHFIQNGRKFSEHDLASELSLLLKQAVERQSECNIRKGILLSGGFDSRLVAGATSNGTSPIHSFTFGTPGCDDARVASTIAEILGTEHHFLEITSDYLRHFASEGVRLTEGLRSCVHFHGISILEELRKQVDLVLTGVSFEFIRGKFLQPRFMRIKDDKALTRILYQKVNTAIRSREEKSIFTSKYNAIVKGVARESLTNAIKKSPVDGLINKIEYYFLRERHRKFIMSGFLYTRTQVEDRNPFYDSDIIDFYLRMPVAAKLNAKVARLALNILKPELHQLPLVNTGIPIEASYALGYRLADRCRSVLQNRLSVFSKGDVCSLRKGSSKKYYTSYPEWLRTDLREFVSSILLDDRTTSRGHFNTDYVKEIINLHLQGKRDYTNVLGVLLTFELWHRIFLD